MKIAIGCDHAAYKEKIILSEFLRNELKHEVVDFGTDSSESVDYPSYGHRVGKSVANKEVDKGIVICGSGKGNGRKDKIRSFDPTVEFILVEFLFKPVTQRP